MTAILPGMSGGGRVIVRTMSAAIPLIAGVAFAADLRPLRVDSAIEQRIEAMSDEEKIGQLLFVGFDGQRVSPELRMLVTEWHVGGVAFYRQNITSPDQVRKLTNAIRSLSEPGPEPFLALDQEGGPVRRIAKGVPELPSAMTLGATRSTDLARRAGLALGSSLRDLGFTMNFAPVVDVLTNPSNSALGNRAFSDDPELTGALGAAFLAGHTEAGVAAVPKHFPGMGATRGDSHTQLPVLDIAEAELRRRELVPFRKVIDAGAPALMTAHIALPGIAEQKDLPVTLSARVMRDLLRRELRFEGVLITDELQMESIRGRRSAGDAAVQAVQAGADMVLVVWDDHDRSDIRDALLKAYGNGALPKARVHEALTRILRLKAQLRGERPRAAADPRIGEEISRRAVTLMGGNGRQLVSKEAPMAYIGPDGALRRRLRPRSWIPTPPRVDDAAVTRVLSQMEPSDPLIIGIASTNDHLLAVALRARVPSRRLILVLLRHPRDAARVEKPDAVIVAYSDTEASQNAAADVLLAARPCAPGLLPITIPGVGKRGDGTRCPDVQVPVPE